MNIRPITIELTGTPNSGKTTLINGLANTLSKQGIKVQKMQEDAELVPTAIPKKTWERNMWITLGQMQSLIEIPFSDADVVLLDRGYCDALFWANFLKLEKACTEDQYQFLDKFLQDMNFKFNLYPDLLFVLDVNVEKSIERRQALGGNIVLTNNYFISFYKQVLDKFYKEFTNPKYYLDSSNLSIEEVQETALKKVLEVLE